MVDFGFAFNDKQFSDRVLHLQIIPKGSTLHTQTRTEISPVGVKVESLHINTSILAANSPIFYKLFKNERKKAEKKDVTLVINSSEEQAALMDVLKFIYKNSLRATTPSDLLAVLMAADKFQVTCCMQYCIQVLLKLPISLDHAMLHVNRPPSLLSSETVQPLIDASNDVLAGYIDFSESQAIAMELPLCAIEFILKRDGLRVNSEDDVFDFILKWGRARYPNLKQRIEILTKRLWPLVNFRYMSSLRLKQVLVCTEFEREHASKVVSAALQAKEETPYGRHLHPLKDDHPRRVYLRPLVKVVQLDFPRPRCLVYFNLRREECASLFPLKRLNSQSFVLGGRSFFLSVQCKAEEPRTFGLFLYRPTDSDKSNVDLEFAVMSKSSDEFSRKGTVKNHTLEEGGWGFPDLLKISWAKFMSDDSEYFINDILHLQAKITLNNSS